MFGLSKNIKITELDKQAIIDLTKEHFISHSMKVDKGILHHCFHAAFSTIMCEKANLDDHWTKRLYELCMSYYEHWLPEWREHRNMVYKQKQQEKRFREAKEHLDKNRKKPPIWARNQN